MKGLMPSIKIPRSIRKLMTTGRSLKQGDRAAIKWLKGGARVVPGRRVLNP